MNKTVLFVFPVEDVYSKNYYRICYNTLTTVWRRLCEDYGYEYSSHRVHKTSDVPGLTTSDAGHVAFFKGLPHDDMPFILFLRDFTTEIDDVYGYVSSKAELYQYRSDWIPPEKFVNDAVEAWELITGFDWDHCGRYRAGCCSELEDIVKDNSYFIPQQGLGRIIDAVQETCAAKSYNSVNIGMFINNDEDTNVVTVRIDARTKTGTSDVNRQCVDNLFKLLCDEVKIRSENCGSKVVLKQEEPTITTDMYGNHATRRMVLYADIPVERKETE